MNREIIRTEDGSTTIKIVDWDECYHSTHGAIQEAYHVFIRNGLDHFADKPVHILEIGFGTGLNAFITFLESTRKCQTIDYTAIEAFPVTLEEVGQMNYAVELKAEEFNDTFLKMHSFEWERKTDFNNFSLIKKKMFFSEILFKEEFDLIYFDAFGFRVQPELWSTEVFRIMYEALRFGGCLVTYAARGAIKRSMIEVGFIVEKLPGAPGKREMMRAFKIS